MKRNVTLQRLTALLIVFVIVISLSACALTKKEKEQRDLMIHPPVEETDPLTPAYMSPATASNLTVTVVPEPSAAAEPTETPEPEYEFDEWADYRMYMMVACHLGDVSDGLEMQRLRDLKIDTLNTGEAKVDFYTLFFLSRLIELEAGSQWLPIELRMCVGEVCLNRIASVEFPNDIQDVLYQDNQYFSGPIDHVKPNGEAIEAAWRLCEGERIINDPSVIFQANFPQGKGPAVVYVDEKLGTTYFCYALNLDKYESSNYPMTRSLNEMIQNGNK